VIITCVAAYKRQGEALRLVVPKVIVNLSERTTPDVFRHAEAWEKCQSSIRTNFAGHWAVIG